jgi:hypothetical protein
MHDCNLVFKGIKSILSSLRDRGARFTGQKLIGSVFLVRLGDRGAGVDEALKQFTRNTPLYFLKSRLSLVYRRYRNRRKARGLSG